MKKLILELSNESKYLNFSEYNNEINFIANEYKVVVKYVGNIRFSKAYFKFFIDEEEVKGYILECEFLFFKKQRYMICNWMEELYEIKTIILDLKYKSIQILDIYWNKYRKEGEFIFFENKKKIKKINIKDLIK